MAKKKERRQNKLMLSIKSILDLARLNIPFDAHVHTIHSFDGHYEPEYLMWEARGKGLGGLAFCDHHVLEGMRKLMRENRLPLDIPYFIKENLVVVPGVEITCRVGEVENLKGNSTKIHVKAFGCDWSPDSPISQLMAIKAENDRLVDLGKLDYILKEKGLDKLVPDVLIQHFMREKRKENPGFSTLGLDATVEFFNFIHDLDKKTLAKLGLPEARGPEIRKAMADAGISLKSNRSLMALYSKAPNYSRMNLSAKDVIDAIHASGGIAIMAHPGVNLKRTQYQEKLIQTLENHGIDGYEIAAETPQSKTATLIKGIVRKNGREHTAIYTAGSDTHSFHSGNTLGEHKGRTISCINFQNFFEKMQSLYLARQKGDLSDTPINVSEDQAWDIVHKYDRIGEECKGNFMDSIFPVPEPTVKASAKTAKGVAAQAVAGKTPEAVAHATKKTPSTPPKKKEPTGTRIYTESGVSILLPEGCGPKFIDGLECLNMEEYNALKEWVYSDDRDINILRLAGLLEYKDKVTGKTL